MIRMMNRIETVGVVIKEKNGLYTVVCDNEALLCKAGSRVRKAGVRLVAGDRVSVENNGDGSGFIRDALPRRNCLARPLVANIDTCVIVVAAAAPEPYFYNIDKLTVMAEKAGVEVCIAVNKCDLRSSAELAAVYAAPGYRLFSLCAADGTGVGELRDFIRGKTSVFAGASGVGKSSLLNALYSDLQAETGALSKKISRGKNTTRHTEFFCPEDGTYVADTPGFTMLDAERLGVEKCEELCELFSEFRQHLGSCTYRDCTHLKEEGCAVLAAVEAGTVARSRHESFVRLYGELKNIKRYG